MKPQSKDTYHHGDLRSALIATAIKIIETDGLSALSLRQIAKTTGVSHAAPYAHFRDLNDILAAIKEQGFNELLELISQAATRYSDNKRKLRALATAYMDFAVKQPGKFEIMFHRPLEKEPSIPYNYIETGKLIFQEASTAICGVLPKSSKKKDIQQRTIVCWSAIHGLCSLWVGGTLPIIADASAGVSLQQIASEHIERLITDLASD